MWVQGGRTKTFFSRSEMTNILIYNLGLCLMYFVWGLGEDSFFGGGSRHPYHGVTLMYVVWGVGRRFIFVEIPPNQVYSQGFRCVYFVLSRTFLCDGG